MTDAEITSVRRKLRVAQVAKALRCEEGRAHEMVAPLDGLTDAQFEAHIGFLENHTGASKSQMDVSPVESEDTVAKTRASIREYMDDFFDAEGQDAPAKQKTAQASSVDVGDLFGQEE